MQRGLLPLFPLEVVLFPGTPLPLHIFEDRYKELFSEILASGEEFGVVLARGNGILRTGCTAAVDKVLKTYEDGRLDVLTVGHRRFHVLTVNTERTFLRGEVEYFDDDDMDPPRPEAVREARMRHAELVKLLDEEMEEPDPDDPELSFQLARISTDLDFRQTLLDLVSESERMERVAEHLKDLIGKRRIQKVVQKSARTNGHSKHLPELDD